jgi:PhoH-like ATPase
MCRYYAEKNSLKLIQKRRAYGIEARNVEQSFAFDALLDPTLKLVSMSGIAGTGKTLLALAAALSQKENYEQIILARPVIPLQNQQIGFLPGDEKEKITPYMLPLFDNLNFIKNRFGKLSREATQIDDWLRREEVIISPLAYIRGRSLSNVLFIIDEAQNLTPHEVKTIITRAGENTKIILTGDIYQIDSPYLDMYSNGLSYLTDKMSGQKLYAHIDLVKGERSELAEIAGKLL